MPDPLEALRRDYGLRLGAKLEALAALLREARQAPTAEPALASARRMAHTLHGTAGSYGFGEIAESCGRIADALARIAAGATEQATEQAWIEIDHALAEARSGQAGP